jgi:LysR family transcriptional regulator for metE and metH
VKENLVNFGRRTSLRQLRALGAVAQTGGISAAAGLLGVTPPAVSQQLKLLQDALGGVPLLERGPAGNRASEAGREVLAALGRVEAALADCAAAIDALRAMDVGRVSVGVISTAKYFAPFALAAFQRRHPRIELQLRVANRREMVAALEGFELDLAIMGYPPEHLALDRVVLGEHPHVIIAAPGHPLVGRGRISLAEAAAQTFLLREPGSGTRDLMQRLFGAAETAGGRRIEIGSNETIKQAVMADMGVALLSAHTVAAEVADGRLVILDVEGLPVLRQWFLVRRTEKRPLPAAAALWAYLVDHGEGFLPKLAAASG